MRAVNKISTVYFFLVILNTASITWGQEEFKTLKEVQGLPIGTSVEDFSANDQDDSLFNLKSALLNGPVVLVFYRGQWCPFCNRHLSNIQDSLELLQATGAQIIAISPEKPEYLEKMEEKTGSAFRLLYDEGYKIEEAFGLVFKPENSEILKYNTFLNARLEESHSDDSGRLPVPATFIISQEGIIVWRQFDPDYKNRSTVADIIANIPISFK